MSYKIYQQQCMLQILTPTQPNPTNLPTDRQCLQEALSGETTVKFALFSGHDTVVAPLLAALGAYNCRWPPYASHVAFELWSKPSGDVDESKDNPKKSRRALVEVDENKGNGDGNDEIEDGNTSHLLPPEGEQGGESKKEKEEEEAYVRVTFNGQPVTHLIKDCVDLNG